MIEKKDLKDENIDKLLTKDEIIFIQENLKIAGYYNLIDGIYGENTKAALDSYTNDKMGKVYEYYNEDIKENLIENNKDKLAGNINDYLVLVNKKRNLMSYDIPNNLVDISVNHMEHVKEIDKKTNDVLIKMFDDAKKEGIKLRVVSGYRDFFYQVDLFDSYTKNHGFDKANTYSALPGQSEHQTGFVVDLDDENPEFTLERSFEETEAFKWLDDNAHKYGFILRYPKGKEELTGYIYEPWHYRYVGSADIATEIYQKGLILEQYLTLNNKL